jgi:hypothetical protein
MAKEKISFQVTTDSSGSCIALESNGFTVTANVRMHIGSILTNPVAVWMSSDQQKVCFLAPEP